MHRFTTKVQQDRLKSLLQSIHLRIHGCVLATNKYGSYCVPASSRHRPAASAVLSGEVYEPETIEFMTANCGRGDIVHAGTYFGDFLPALARGCAPAAQLWAFEPNRENYRCARLTLQIKGIRNVRLANAGLGSRQGRLRMRVSDENGIALGGGSRIVPGGPAVVPYTEEIQILTIDEVVGEDRSVSIVQLDVEGHEQDALAGGLGTIRRCRPILILEVGSDRALVESAWFGANIVSLGYQMRKSLHSNSVFVCKSDGPTVPSRRAGNRV